MLRKNSLDYFSYSSKIDQKRTFPNTFDETSICLILRSDKHTTGKL